MKKIKIATPNMLSVGYTVPIYENTILHVKCENCGREAYLTPKEISELGWDYAPICSPYRVIAPRLCPNCSLHKSVWFKICIQRKSFPELSAKDLSIIERILREPEC